MNNARTFSNSFCVAVLFAFAYMTLEVSRSGIIFKRLGMKTDMLGYRETTDKTSNSKLSMRRITAKFTADTKNCALNTSSSIYNKEDESYFKVNPAMEIYTGEIRDFTGSISRVFPVFSDSVIRLNPDRFLLPFLLWGPNNQLEGMRDSIYVAIRLNRTFVIPKFKRHYSDNVKGSPIHPSLRVDFDRLCQFISCITIDQFKKACGNQGDLVLNMRSETVKMLPHIGRILGVRLYKLNETQMYNVTLLPEKVEGVRFEFNSSKAVIQKIFKSEERCAVHGQPFQNLQINDSAPSSKRMLIQSDLDSLSDSDLYSEIIRNTPLPKFIRDVVEDFVKTVIREKKFIAVHWRYNKDDWMKRCGPKTNIWQCKEASITTPKFLANAIQQKAKELENSVGEINKIYIAVPRSAKDFIAAAVKYLTSQNYTVYQLEDLHNFTVAKYGSCDFIWKNVNDIESNLEMEVCSRSSIFIYSSPSTWSWNVLKQRLHSPTPHTFPDKDKEVLVLTVKVRKDIVKNLPWMRVSNDVDKYLMLSQG